jgi:hypothetical protein
MSDRDPVRLRTHLTRVRISSSHRYGPFTDLSREQVSTIINGKAEHCL